ncbi:DNA helicase-2/ATP-dependent DNA helicase PcrA [Paenibacillus sp. JGP012]|uniref:UvrD-helicase domain-containing protein n=1 Tax=Paenibacillus sp. JGP012 TaxID=2735914 RepID=UPI00161B85E0|nr:UvrD-helicase domain-containing protein [Paenibacillus sp. JGP012]MBB6023784.1 DNA helicase-2/ATP-dependent DNA helicase PcrA [Paenibacillus sp. JGP012]
MKRKLNNRLIIAAAGSGKTSELTKEIIKMSRELPPEKCLAVITYTNSATNEILERVQKYISVQHNIFVGTIHSFLIKFLIKPYGKILGLVPNELIITDYEIKIAKSSNQFMEKNIIVNQLSKKGVMTYDYIITLSKKILLDENVKNRFCNRIRYLLVDEFQDSTNTQFEIFDILRKGKSSELILVGDPEQRIMNFRNKPRKGKGSSGERSIPLHPIESLQNKKIYTISKLMNNYRSSETIVKFINQFHSSIEQEWANKEISSKNPVMFIESTKLKSIIFDFNNLCINKAYCESIPKTRFFLAHENKVYKNYRYSNFDNKSTEKLPLFTCIYDYLSAFYNTKNDLLHQTLGLDEIELRKKCLSVFYEINYNLNINLDEFPNFIENTFSRKKVETGENVSYNIRERTKRLADDLSNRITPDKEYLSIELSEYRDSFLTIHKSKGLQADAALVIAKNEKELLMWLEDDKEKRLNDPQDKCRLGYVAFSRPKEFLCIACLTPVSEPTLHLLNKFKVNIYSPLTEQVQTTLETL